MRGLLRAIPHKNFIKVMFLAGIPLKATKNVEGIDDIMVSYDFNSLSMEIYENILKECEAIPGGKKMMTENRKAMEFNSTCYDKDKGKDLIIVESVYDAFRKPKLFHDLIMRYGIKPWKRESIVSHKVMRLLTLEKPRKFIECAVLANLTLLDIVSCFSQMYKGKYHITRFHLYSFIYYFWNVHLSAMKRNGIKLEDVLKYIESYPQNDYYDLHGDMIFKGPDAVKIEFGVQSEEERRIDNNRRRSRAACKIDQALRNKYIKNVPQYIIEIFKHTDDQLAELERKDEGKESLREEVDQMFRRLTRSKAIRKRLDQLKEIPSDPEIKKRLYPKDEPFKLKK